MNDAISSQAFRRSGSWELLWRFASCGHVWAQILPQPAGPNRNAQRTTLLTVDASDGAKLKRFFDSDQPSSSGPGLLDGLRVNVTAWPIGNNGHTRDRHFEVENYGTVTIERQKAASEGQETYKLTFPSVSRKGTATMTVTGGGNFLG